MKKAMWLIGLTAFLVGCGGQPPAAETAAPAAPATPAAPPAKAYANLAQVMRAIPFTGSNIIFDAQSNDPGAPKSASNDSGATSRFASVYGGWQNVEHSSLSLSETANLILIPGRLCENGKPVPVDQADFKQWTADLAAVGLEAYQAALTKNQDKVVEVSDKVAQACANCHEKYRDVSEGKPRCTP